MATLVSLLTDYTESVLAKALDQKTLIAKFQYLPDLNTLKKHLDDCAAKPLEDAQREKRLREQLADRKRYAPQKPREFYTGPIEDVRPGDILSFERLVEYDKFMKEKHGIKPKHWTATEEWQDNGQRPFSVKIKEEKNPFE